MGGGKVYRDIFAGVICFGRRFLWLVVFWLGGSGEGGGLCVYIQPPA